jgi:hypothetical protein
MDVSHALHEAYKRASEVYRGGELKLTRDEARKIARLICANFTTAKASLDTIIRQEAELSVKERELLADGIDFYINALELQLQLLRNLRSTDH